MHIEQLPPLVDERYVVKLNGMQHNLDEAWEFWAHMALLKDDLDALQRHRTSVRDLLPQATACTSPIDLMTLYVHHYYQALPARFYRWVDEDRTVDWQVFETVENMGFQIYYNRTEHRFYVRYDRFVFTI